MFGDTHIISFKNFIYVFIYYYYFYLSSRRSLVAHRSFCRRHAMLVLCHDHVFWGFYRVVPFSQRVSLSYPFPGSVRVAHLYHGRDLVRKSPSGEGTMWVFWEGGDGCALSLTVLMIPRGLAAPKLDRGIMGVIANVRNRF